jgi:CubicO group peptidase (beta-lactamase class C family)
MWMDYSGFTTGFYGYGYGFEVYEDSQGRTVGHGGSAPGVSAILHIRPETGYVIVVLSNYNGAAVPIAKRLSDLVSQTKD